MLGAAADVACAMAGFEAYGLTGVDEGACNSHEEVGILWLPPVLQVLYVAQEGVIFELARLRKP